MHQESKWLGTQMCQWESNPDYETLKPRLAGYGVHIYNHSITWLT